jgi:hypothetical protein
MRLAGSIARRMEPPESQGWYWYSWNVVLIRRLVAGRILGSSRLVCVEATETLVESLLPLSTK